MNHWPADYAAAYAAKLRLRAPSSESEDTAMADADEAATTNPRPLAAPTARSERARKRRNSATASGPKAAGPSRPTKKVKKGAQTHAAQVGPSLFFPSFLSYLLTTSLPFV